MEEAITWLREKGISKAAKKQSRIAAEGLASVKVSGNKAVIVEVNSETDFVAKNPEFTSMVESILKAIVAADPKTEEDVLNLTVDGETVNELIVNKTAKIGEKLSFRRFVKVTKNDKVGYMPDVNNITLKLIADRRSHRILGAQAIGCGDADKKINSISIGLSNRVTVENLLDVDFTYAPPFSTSVDIVHSAARMLKSKIS
jgi:hypothetical protein